MSRMEAMGVEGGEQESRDYEDHSLAPLLDSLELKRWSFYRATMAEFVATLLFLFITLTTVVENKRSKGTCGGVGLLGEASAFGGMISVLVYCISAISGGHVNPAVTFALFLARKVSLPRALAYIVAQCLGALCGTALVRGMQGSFYASTGGGSNSVSTGYSKGTALLAEIIGTFVLVYTVFSAADPKRKARHSHIPVLAPIPIGLAVFLVHLATIPITGTGINPARSFGPAVIYGNKKSWDDLSIFWAGPLIGAAVATAYHQYLLRGGGFGLKNSESFRSHPTSVI
eukprot:PITA_14657